MSRKKRKDPVGSTMRYEMKNCKVIPVGTWLYRVSRWLYLYTDWYLLVRKSHFNQQHLAETSYWCYHKGHDIIIITIIIIIIIIITTPRYVYEGWWSGKDNFTSKTWQWPWWITLNALDNVRHETEYPPLEHFLAVKSELAASGKWLHCLWRGCGDVWTTFKEHVYASKHRKNCECCPGHYLIVNHYSSI